MVFPVSWNNNRYLSNSSPFAMLASKFFLLTRKGYMIIGIKYTVKTVLAKAKIDELSIISVSNTPASLKH